jgi:hypothetical protein
MAVSEAQREALTAGREKFNRNRRLRKAEETLADLHEHGELTDAAHERIRTALQSAIERRAS